MSRARSARRIRWWQVGLGLAGAALVAALGRDAPDLVRAPPPDVPAVVEAFRTGRSDVPVDGAGVVVKVLPDDRDGARHQRFVLALPSGHTVLVAHNIDLAPRILGLRRGDRVRFRGDYEWNERGGVLHWTHRDPAARHRGGWLEHGGRRYE